jgi:hypothetical protein
MAPFEVLGDKPLGSAFLGTLVQLDFLLASILRLCIAQSPKFLVPERCVWSKSRVKFSDVCYHFWSCNRANTMGSAKLKKTFIMMLLRRERSCKTSIVYILPTQRSEHAHPGSSGRRCAIPTALCICDSRRCRHRRPPATGSTTRRPRSK